MNRIARIIGSVIGTALILSCSGKQEKGVTLHFWQFWDMAWIEPLIDEFEAAHPGLEVEVEQLTWSSGLEKIQAAVASGTQPDLCELGSTWVPRFSYEGVLMDLTPVYEELADSFLMWDSAVWKGRVYGLPWLQGSRVLFFNKELFRQAGLDPGRPPDTWSELLEAAKRIHALGPDVYGFGLNLGERYVLYKKFMALAWGNGGRIIDDGGRIVFNSPENLEALRFYLELADYSLKEKQAVMDNYFKTGRLGLQISGAWNLRNIAVEAPELDYGVTLIPRPSAQRGMHASFAGAEILVVFKNSKHAKAALQLARFLQSYPAAKALSLSEKSVFPAAVQALADSTFLKQEKVGVFVKQALTCRSAPPHPGWIEMEEVINQAIEQVLYGKIDPETALSGAQAKLDAIARRFE